MFRVDARPDRRGEIGKRQAGTVADRLAEIGAHRPDHVRDHPADEARVERPDFEIEMRGRLQVGRDCPFPLGNGKDRHGRADRAGDVLAKARALFDIGPVAAAEDDDRQRGPRTMGIGQAVMVTDAVAVMGLHREGQHQPVMQQPDQVLLEACDPRAQRDDRRRRRQALQHGIERQAALADGAGKQQQGRDIDRIGRRRAGAHQPHEALAQGPLGLPVAPDPPAGWFRFRHQALGLVRSHCPGKLLFGPNGRFGTRLRSAAGGGFTSGRGFPQLRHHRFQRAVQRRRNRCPPRGGPGLVPGAIVSLASHARLVRPATDNQMRQRIVVPGPGLAPTEAVDAEPAAQDRDRQRRETGGKREQRHGRCADLALGPDQQAALDRASQRLGLGRVPEPPQEEPDQPRLAQDGLPGDSSGTRRAFLPIDQAPAAQPRQHHAAGLVALLRPGLDQPGDRAREGDAPGAGELLVVEGQRERDGRIVDRLRLAVARDDQAAADPRDAVRVVPHCRVHGVQRAVGCPGGDRPALVAVPLVRKPLRVALGPGRVQPGRKRLHAGMAALAPGGGGFVVRFVVVTVAHGVLLMVGPPPDPFRRREDAWMSDGQCRGPSAGDGTVRFPGTRHGEADPPSGARRRGSGVVRGVAVGRWRICHRTGVAGRAVLLPRRPLRLQPVHLPLQADREALAQIRDRRREAGDGKDPLEGGQRQDARLRLVDLAGDVEDRDAGADDRMHPGLRWRASRARPAPPP